MKLTKEEVYKALLEEETLYYEPWYFMMFGGVIIGNCGYEDYCNCEYDNFEKFWKNYGNKDLRIIK